MNQPQMTNRLRTRRLEDRQLMEERNHLKERAEQAEARLAECEKNLYGGQELIDQLRERLAALTAALEFYAKREHWMALTALGNKDRNVILTGHSKLGDETNNGWTVAEAALAAAKGGG